MQVDLDGKVAVVSGGSSGMGAAVCERLADSGAAVVVGGRDETRTAAVVDAVRAAGGDAVAGQGDVADSTQAASLVDTAVATFGGIAFLTATLLFFGLRTVSLSAIGRRGEEPPDIVER